MAPEQVSTGTVTHLADIYAYGLVLYELFTGSPVFAGENIQQLFYAVLHTPVEAGPLLQAGVPASLAQMIVQCAAKDPANRPPNLFQIREELGRFIDETGGVETRMPTLVTRARLSTSAMPVAVARPVGAGTKSLTMPALIGALVIALLAVAGGIWYVLRSESKPAIEATIQATGGEMELVPAGAFLSGANRQSVPLPAFYIDRTEVTNRAYAEYAKATGVALPAGFPASKPEFPAVNITFHEAAAFAQWAGKRLPTSKEWEKAARGTDGRRFPWGQAADSTRAQTGKGKQGSAVPAVSFASGESPYHVLQMVGNVWEWVDEATVPAPAIREQFGHILNPPPAPHEVWRMIRGGSYVEPLDPDVLTGFVSTPARYHSAIIGFRCVKAIRE
jgi:serine/threonine-protein kinase